MAGSIASSVRRALYARPGRQVRLRRPVVSVGNISFGGRGKTPVVGLIARMLVEAGHRPAILTRGYGRRVVEDGVVVVSDGEHLLADLARSGDEPMLLARDVPGACVLVCDQRSLAGSLAERSLGATVHILDDGFQHLQLARDLDLVIVSPTDLTDRPMPFGRLREPVASLARAHAILMDASIQHQRSDVGSVNPQFTIQRTIGEPVPLEPERPWDGESRRVIAVAGIAGPARFASSLKEVGWTVAAQLDFPDHHRYTHDDLRRIVAEAEKANAAVLMTSKDAVRMMPLRPLPIPMAYIPLNVTVEPRDAFRALLFDRLHLSRG